MTRRGRAPENSDLSPPIPFSVLLEDSRPPKLALAVTEEHPDTEVDMLDERKTEQYEEPKVADYGDLAEITAARTLTPPKIDLNYNSGQNSFTPFS
jgi:hypothetical protein